MSQITDLASYLTTHLPQGEVPPDEAREAWRSQLRRARSAGAGPWLAGLVVQQAPADDELRARCEVLLDEPAE